MTDTQVIAVCAAVVVIGFFALIAWRIWLDYKDDMREEE